MLPRISIARHVIWISICWLLLPAMDTIQAQRPAGNEIMFLRLRVRDDTISLVRLTTSPGKLKHRDVARSAGGILYNVISSSGESLWSGSIDDPAVRRYEYEDPEFSGQIKTKVVAVNDVEFTLRIPVIKGIRRITFDRPARTFEQNGKPAYRRIGSLDVPGGDDR
jgi:hypothetical protein